ncbi:MAG: HNH endonuclease [Gemmatimonadota bacterium]|nr:HNH endonuclease [Gemmatimonadota bacterium]
MDIKLVVAVTDGDWFKTLRQKPHLDEVNFWAPSPKNFKALRPGELFLFKRHAPHNVIVGGGVFAYANEMPCSLAWEAFGEANGAGTLQEMRDRISHYRNTDPNDLSDFRIGCRILTQPFFFEESEYIKVPSSWSPNIVSFKTFSTNDSDGRELWDAVNGRLVFRQATSLPTDPSGIVAEHTDLLTGQALYGKPQLVKPRLGQGAFRTLVTDLYDRRCAVTRERTLPALDAAHIRPFSDGGLHEASNGLLLRRDIHGLFDSGYVTVTPDLRFEVSGQVREEFENGRDYYAMHGNKIVVPKKVADQPDTEVLSWHNEKIYKG